MDADRLSAADRTHLDRARIIARRGWGRVHPNPVVGCVLVNDDVVVAEGVHERYGGPHAEVAALAQAGDAAKGATAYVSLEPCDHHGKTPPCSGALVQAGVARVVYGAADPGAESGGGGATLRAAGLEVEGPVWGTRTGRAENPAFFHTARHESPFVALKLAMSLDGKIAAESGKRTRITGAEAEREVHRIRSGFDAVCVGAGTARTDDPRLTVRLDAPGHVPPRRVVIGSRPEVAPDAALLEGREEAPLHLIVRDDSDDEAVRRAEALGAAVHPVRGDGAGVDPAAALKACWDLGMRSILCEGGARLAATLLRGGFVHRLYLFVAPVTLGEGGLAAFGDGAAELDWAAFEPSLSAERHGRDTLIVLDRQED